MDNKPPSPPPPRQIRKIPIPKPPSPPPPLARQTKDRPPQRSTPVPRTEVYQPTKEEKAKAVQKFTEMYLVGLEGIMMAYLRQKPSKLLRATPSSAQTRTAGSRSRRMGRICGWRLRGSENDSRYTG